MTKFAPVTLSELLDSLPAGPNSSVAQQVRTAYDFAEAAHAGRHRESRELHIEHDLAVAHILSQQLRLDTHTIVAGLLHDILLPHTKQTEETIRKRFGPEVTGLITGLAKLEPYTEKHGQVTSDKTLESIRQAILTIIEGDIRVILIRMADCLQDLRKAGELPAEQQHDIAGEARDIYAPLANRLGIWQLKWELEDLAFRFLEPEQYRAIAGQLDERRDERNQRIDTAARTLTTHITQAGLKASVSGRPKHIYSIYRKMQHKDVDFAHIYDVRALRVILEDKDPNLCYQVLGIVHNLWQPVPQEFDDYVARPKPNGYQSLHTAVIDENGQTLEVQIRTREMHDEAERGIAAHWAYKEGGRQNALLNKHVQWLRQLLSTLRETEEAAVDSEAFKAEVLGERIYVFTPRGDVIDLPAGSTPVDFAYQIHSEVGHRCRGARINGKMVSLDYKLKSGEKVEIITANRGGPSRDWLNESLGYTASARSRSKIRSWFRQQEREKNIQQGREVVNRELRRLGVNETYTIEDIADALKFKDVEQFLAAVGFGDVQAAQVGGAIASLQQKLKPDDELLQLLKLPPKPTGLTVRGLSGLATNMARCCTPIPPEPIVGYVTRGRGVTIHRQDCAQLASIHEPERIIDVEWGLAEQTYAIPIVIKAYDRSGLMGDIANILKTERVNLAKAKTTTSNSMATIYLVAEISTLDQLSWILRKIEGLPNVVEAQRQRWTD
jgi:RelA/SpoT family (p)ppGpp synthetase